MQNDDTSFELEFDEPDTVNAADQGETTTVTDESGVEAEQVNDGDGEPTGDNSEPAERELTDEEKAAQAEKAKADAKAKAEAEEAERQAALVTFQAHVNSLFDHEDYDKLTGVLPEVLSQSVVDEYAKLPGAKGKALGRSWLESSMQENMILGAGEGGPAYFMRARTFMELNTKVTKDKATKSETAARPKVDPTTAHVNRIAAMLLAPNLVPVGEGVEDGWETKAEELVTSLADDTAAYRDWLSVKDKPVAEGETAPEAPKVSDVVIAAAKIAQGRAASAPRKASTGTSTPRVSTAGSGHSGDIGKHLREVMDTVEVGTFLTIAEIVNKVTSQYGGEAPKPSPGAIAARLFPAKGGECNLDFVKPEGKDDGRAVKGAVRVA